MTSVLGSGTIVGPRTGDLRARRGRGMRGVRALPGPLSPTGIPGDLSPSARFDRLVQDMVIALSPAFKRNVEPVEVVVEDTPTLPELWDQAVPTSVATRIDTGSRIVLFRLPLQGRSSGRHQLEAVTWSVLLEQLGSIWNVSADEIDPRG